MRAAVARLFAQAELPAAIDAAGALDKADQRLIDASFRICGGDFDAWLGAVQPSLRGAVREAHEPGRAVALALNETAPQRRLKAEYAHIREPHDALRLVQACNRHYRATVKADDAAVQTKSADPEQSAAARRVLEADRAILRAHEDVLDRATEAHTQTIAEMLARPLLNVLQSRRSALERVRPAAQRGVEPATQADVSALEEELRALRHEAGEVA